MSRSTRPTPPICTNRWPARSGARSPTEKQSRASGYRQQKDLAAVLGVNTNTVLRSLRLLRDEGLLEFRRGRGISVAGTPERGAVVQRARELVDCASQSGATAWTSCSRSSRTSPEQGAPVQATERGGRDRGRSRESGRRCPVRPHRACPALTTRPSTKRGADVSRPSLAGTASAASACARGHPAQRGPPNATATACALVWTPSFERMCWMWSPPSSS